MAAAKVCYPPDQIRRSRREAAIQTEHSTSNTSTRAAWNAGMIVGPKAPLKPKGRLSFEMHHLTDYWQPSR
jgi:hypothetical protein